MNIPLTLTCLVLALAAAGGAQAQNQDNTPRAQDTHTRLPACLNPPDGDTEPGQPGVRGNVTLEYQHWTGGLKESAHNYTCRADEIMVSRSHYGDENADTYYRCAIAKQNGVQIKLIDTISYGPYNEKKGIAFSCPRDTVMVGRSHYGDTESGNTYYRCATPLSGYWDDDPMQVTNMYWSTELCESKHTYTCPDPSVLIGRFHEGDENGDTQYQCGKMW